MEIAPDLFDPANELYKTAPMYHTIKTYLKYKGFRRGGKVDIEEAVRVATTRKNYTEPVKEIPVMFITTWGRKMSKWMQLLDYLLPRIAWASLAVALAGGIVAIGAMLAGR
jgi:hypothetical protein